MNREAKNSSERICRAFAFTMAEILISLTIIGIISVITLPALRTSVNDRVWDTQRKALLSRMTQAIGMMRNLNIYGEYEATNIAQGGVDVSKDTAALTFLLNGLGKTLKIKNTCTLDEGFDKCGMPNTITTAGNKKLGIPTKLSELHPQFATSYEGTGYHPSYSRMDTEAVAFETTNGESIVAYYNPYCISAPDRATVASFVEDFMESHQTFVRVITEDNLVLKFENLMCTNFIYDLNGKKGPNKMYKDIGYMTAFYPTDSVVVAPVQLLKQPKNPDNNSSTYLPQPLASRACHNMDINSRVPTAEEFMSINVNNTIAVYGAPETNGGALWSSYVVGPYAYAFFKHGLSLIDKDYYLSGDSNAINNVNSSYTFKKGAGAVCVKK